MSRDVLRVASYNVRDLRDDPAAAARVVRAIDPDVLCLQEVPRHPFSGHRVADFAQRCGLFFAGGHRGSGGTTVLTRLALDVHEARHVGLPVPRLQRQRGYAVARVAWPGHLPLTVASIHLGLDAAERERHVAQLLEEVGAAESLVVAGDLNELSTGRAWAALAGRLPRVTGEEPTFSARHPRMCIDAVFATVPVAAGTGPGDGSGGDTRGSSGGGPGNSGRGTVVLSTADLVAASDHLPVWVDLDVGGLRIGASA